MINFTVASRMFAFIAMLSKEFGIEPKPEVSIGDPTLIRVTFRSPTSADNYITWHFSNSGDTTDFFQFVINNRTHFTYYNRASAINPIMVILEDRPTEERPITSWSLITAFKNKDIDFNDLVYKFMKL